MWMRLALGQVVRIVSFQNVTVRRNAEALGTIAAVLTVRFGLITYHDEGDPLGGGRDPVASRCPVRCHLVRRASWLPLPPWSKRRRALEVAL